ncbi:MAG: amino acid-binding protein, partial [Gammaproteobacteria bacterium]|nr:amino acid-binding protein [Gammaproteobacteria bacterium]
ALAAAGFNILDLESDVAGTASRPVYIMQIAGVADAPVESIEHALEPLRRDGVDVNVSAIETYIG